MADLRLYRVALRIPLPYRFKLLALAVVAAGLPLAALIIRDGGDHPAAIGWAFAATLLSLAALVELLRPIGVVARTLERAAAPRDEAVAPDARDEAARMICDARGLTAELEALRERAHGRHSHSRLPTRESFLASIGLSDRPRSRTGVLGILRLVDYDLMAVFDQGEADAVLAALAGRLTAAVGERRPLGHIDRDCFALWFDDVEGAQSATSELDALANGLRQELSAGGVRLTPKVTVSAAVFPDDADDPATLLARACAAAAGSDERLERKVALFSNETAAAARERFALEQGLRGARGREEFLLNYQPVVDLSVGAVVGAEALLRWRGPDGGLVAPAHFIPVLEQSGMMEEVGLWVLNAACREARSWERAGLAGMKMAVNLSARQLREASLLNTIVRTLDRHGLDPASLELELTESAALVDDDGTRALLGELRALGVTVAIDDFGTGYSSLSNLRKLPFSKLKIDREFVAGVDKNRDNHAICSSLIALARGLDITVLAEGAETLEEVQTLHGLGCSAFQGFFFSRPLPAAEFVEKVRSEEWLALLASPVHRELASLSRRVAG